MSRDLFTAAFYNRESVEKSIAIHDANGSLFSRVLEVKCYLYALLIHPPIVGIDIELFSADGGNQSNTETLGDLHSQTGRR